MLRWRSGASESPILRGFDQGTKGGGHSSIRRGNAKCWAENQANTAGLPSGFTLTQFIYRLGYISLQILCYLIVPGERRGCAWLMET